MNKLLKYRYRFLKGLYPYAYGVKKCWMVLLLFSIVSVLLGFLEPILYKLFINQVIVMGDLETLKIVLVGYILVFAGSISTKYIVTFVKYRFINQILYKVRLKIMNDLLSMPFTAYEDLGVGDAKIRMDEDTEHIKEFASNQTIDYLMSIITTLVSMWMLLSINWGLALLGFTVIPFTLWIADQLSRRENKIWEGRRDNLQEMSSWLHASIQGWREVKALNYFKHEKRVFYYYLHKDMIFFSRWINYWTARILVIPKIKDECFLQFILYLFGGLLIIKGKMNIGDLLVFAVYYSMLSDAVQKIASANAELQTRMPHLDRIMESIGRKKSEKQEKIAIDSPEDIRFNHVHFQYPNTEKEVITDFNLHIRKGERVAIVGKSGCGKTTILKLLTGMLKPTKGQVYISDVDLEKIDDSCLSKKISFVMQSNILFHTTIRENLYFSKKDATEEELLLACRKACILEFIQGLPEGLDTIIGEKGINLSGGQRQRIVLARMFLQDVDILVLDEATSALDQYSESIVHDAIEHIARDKTIIIVSHRESSIRLCDRVINLKAQKT